MTSLKTFFFYYLAVFCDPVCKYYLSNFTEGMDIYN